MAEEKAMTMEELINEVQILETAYENRGKRIEELGRICERLQAIVECCAAECEPDESLEVNERVAVLAQERDDLKDLATRAVVAYHVRNHSSFVGKRLYQECPEPFCVQARKLGLPDSESAKEK